MSVQASITNKLTNQFKVVITFQQLPQIFGMSLEIMLWSGSPHSCLWGIGARTMLSGALTHLPPLSSKNERDNPFETLYTKNAILYFWLLRTLILIIPSACVLVGYTP